MKIRYFLCVFICTLVCIISINHGIEEKYIRTKEQEQLNIKKLLEDTEDNNDDAYDNNNELRLYSKASCVYDCEGKNYLYSNNANVKLPMASTTKIMTCIIALESGYIHEKAIVSKYAASMPNVQLHVSPGEIFTIKDLLYSLMLESHNDVAVTIAENIASKKYNMEMDINNIEQSKELVSKFAQMMTKKARELGLYNTNFVTPNGLDANNHYTTAAELAKIGAYAIENKEFVEITNTRNHGFKSLKGKMYSVSNRNNFLTMYNGAIGCKTGYTSKAGYCFVGAIKRENYKLVSVVLGCGWPPNKNYKWSDTRKLMDYAIDNYKIKELCINNDTLKIDSISVVNGASDKVYIKINEQIRLLLNEKAKIRYEVVVPKSLYAPLKKGQEIGLCKVYLNNNIYKIFRIKLNNNVEKYTYFDKVKELLLQL